MAHFKGRLQGPSLDPTTVVIEIEDDRFRVSAGRTHIGSWAIKRISAERTSIYRFDLDIDGDPFDFFPEDPSAFSDSFGAVIDLTDTMGRFGLKARIERTANG